MRTVTITIDGAPKRFFLRRIAIRGYQSSLIRNFITKFVKIKQPKKWIFVIGCYDSGTTLLQNLLAYHHEISTLPVEGATFTKYLRRPEEFGWTMMWVKCKSKIELPRRYEPEMAKNIMRDWSPWFDESASIFLEKSVSNLVRMQWLEENFKPASFIGIIRNGLAVAEGIRRRARPWRYKDNPYKTRYPIELCAKQWQVASEVMDSESQKVERFYLVKYEDLVKEPVKVLRNLWRWLGLKPEPIKVYSDTLNICGRQILIRDKNQESINRLCRDEIERVLNIIHPGMIRYGYIMDPKI